MDEKKKSMVFYIAFIISFTIVLAVFLFVNYKQPSDLEIKKKTEDLQKALKTIKEHNEELDIKRRKLEYLVKRAEEKNRHLSFEIEELKRTGCDTRK